MGSQKKAGGGLFGTGDKETRWVYRGEHATKRGTGTFAPLSTWVKGDRPIGQQGEMITGKTTYGKGGPVDTSGSKLGGGLEVYEGEGTGQVNIEDLRVNHVH